MSWYQIIIVSLFLQALFINSINGDALHRRRRRQQQQMGSIYGTPNLGVGPSGYNSYPSNMNFYGNNLNNPGMKDPYGNQMMPSNPANSMNNMGSYNSQQQSQQQQQAQQQQPSSQQQPSLYGQSGQSLQNPSFGTGGLYSPGGTNPLMRDPNANMGMRDSNLIPGGSSGSSLYPSLNSPMGYQPNPNQMLNNKDLYNPSPNTNNNPYGFNTNTNNNNNLLPNSNAYNAQTSMNQNPNNNLWANTNTNTNNNNPYGYSNPNSLYQNRELNNNNNNNPYQSQSYYYNNGYRLITSCLSVFLSLIIVSLFHY